MSKLEKIFSDLNKWRHFPKYQLERHAGIFFSIYLPEILEDCLKIKVKPHVIPEMPIYKEGNNQSTNVDYLLVGKDDDKDYVYLVELKTDIAYLSESQDKSMKELREKSFSDLWEGLIDIVIATQNKKKYCHLLCALGETGILRLDKEFESYFYPDSRAKNGITLKERLEAVMCDDLKIEVIYILPNKKHKKLNSTERIIYFEDIHRALKEKFKDDKVANIFAHYLSLWEEDAGVSRPSQVKNQGGYRI